MSLTASSELLSALLGLAGVEPDLVPSRSALSLDEMASLGVVDVSGEQPTLSEATDALLSVVLGARAAVACERISPRQHDRIAYYVASQSVVEHVATTNGHTLEEVPIASFGERLTTYLGLSDANEQPRAKARLSGPAFLARLGGEQLSTGDGSLDVVADAIACARVEAAVGRGDDVRSLELLILDSASTGVWLVEPSADPEAETEILDLIPASRNDITSTVIDFIVSD
jgi:hypothetical protein